MTLEQASIGQRVRVVRIGGARGFRRRLLELGLLPGTLVQLLRVAPLGDPLELRTRGAHLSIRKQEAQKIEIEPVPEDIA